jgi:hypothetical protein
MEPDPSRRYATAREFFEALEEYNAIRPLVARTTPSQSASPSPAAPPASAAPAAKKWQLVQNDGRDTHDITSEGIMVGRDRSCSLVLTHPAVSRRHAKVSLEGGQIVLEDLKSANGTFVNNARVDKINVAEGDVIRFGADPVCSYVLRGSST